MKLYMERDIIKARELLMVIIKRVRRDTGELQQEEIINPLEAAVYTLGELL